MIIELFGAPGAGKTTFATALAERLQEKGCTVELVLSYRPAESARSPGSSAWPGVDHPLASGLRRMGRAAGEMVYSANHLCSASEATEMIKALPRLFPLRSISWSIRLRQYMLRLSKIWNRASSASHIVLFDQGFIQAVCSFVVLSRVSDEARIRHALDMIPKPDRSILMMAPADILKFRLQERRRLQGRFEQMLELTIGDNLRFVSVGNDLFDLLHRNGSHVSRVDSSDPRSIEAVAEGLVQCFVPQEEAVTQ